MNRAARQASAILSSILLAHCAGSETIGEGPSFAAPRNGVFQAPVPVVKSTDDDLLPSIVENSPLIAYASRASVDGNVDIYVRPIAGGAAVRLTTHSADDSDPELSPDGQLIAWTSQADDVKGDVWVMEVEGDNKRRLTDRKTGDRAPTWSPDGKTIYFTNRIPGSGTERIDGINVEEGERRTVVEKGWDPALSPNGKILFFVALDDRPQPRLYAKDLSTGRVAAITDGAFIEGLPRVAKKTSPMRILFTRWVDDQTGDGAVDAEDPPSLWSVVFDADVFEGGSPQIPTPLTAGVGGEIFASVVGDWMVYTTAGAGDLEIYALPVDGVISKGAGPAAILEAARAEQSQALRRLALRYLVSTAPDLAASARYELARELAERERYGDAILELTRVAKAAPKEELAGIAGLEIERLKMLQHLHGVLLIREESERTFIEKRIGAAKTIAQRFPETVAVRARYRSFRAEADYALGRRGEAIKQFEKLAKMEAVPFEDGARALLRIGQIFSDMGDLEAVARVAEATLRRFPGERYYVRHAANGWVDAAKRAVGLPVLAALEKIIHQHPDLPAVAARAASALATEQEKQGHRKTALETWRRISEEYTDERDLLATALLKLGEAAERQDDPKEATRAYERILAAFPESPSLRAKASRGITHINLAKARKEEERGDLEKARQSYRRVLRNNREIVVVHRRFVSLSARLNKLERVINAYQRRAEKNPRDRFARYGYGYALTFERPVPLDKAQREIEAALTLDPRFAAAHIALGWIREQRELEDEKAGWLEKADESYDTARSLLDERIDIDLLAATYLNRGNALRRLGKTDDAFASYLARELSDVPFDNETTELLFRENFARVALREEIFDVALDMARRGEELSASLQGQPRRATLAALIAAISLVTETYTDAVDWYARAASAHETNEDWARMVPMLRGKALALQALGDDDGALETIEELLEIIARGDGPRENIRSFMGNFLRGDLVTEAPANPKNVTRAINGFSSEQEEEIVRALAGRIHRKRGDGGKTARLEARRLELTRDAIVDKRLGPRVKLELLRALHDSGIIHAQLGEQEKALKDFLEAAALAQKLDRWKDGTVALEAVAQIWARAPGLRNLADREAARAVANATLEATETDAEISRRVGRWLALDHFASAISPPTLSATEPEQRLAQSLKHLDAALIEMDGAIEQAQRVGNEDPAGADLLAHLESYAGIRRQEAGPTPEAVAASPLSWRWRFDRSLWDRDNSVQGSDPSWLLAAIEAFERQPAPESAPERNRFLLASMDLLLKRNETKRAWRLLERDRLLQLQPLPRRVQREPLASQWSALRKLRAQPEEHAKALAKAPSLVAALEGQPATLKEVQVALEGEAVLAQAFEPLPGRGIWFTIDAKGVRYIRTTAPATDDLAAVLGESVTGEGAASLIYLDTGEISAQPAFNFMMQGEPLIQRFQVSESLSATYLVAAQKQRNLTDDRSLAVGVSERSSGVIEIPAGVASRESIARFGAGRKLLRIALPGERHLWPMLGSGATQVVFKTARGVPPSERIDLDQIASLSLSTGLAIADAVPSDPATARAVAQAFLLAGIPTCIVGSATSEDAKLLEAVAAEISHKRASELFAQQVRLRSKTTLRLYGYRGMTLAERVDFALGEVLRLARAGAPLFNQARKKRDKAIWRKTQPVFEALLDTIGFLRHPDSTAQLTKSKHRLAGPIGSRLAKYEVDNRANLAQIHLALGHIDEATALQQLVVRTHEKSGNLQKVATATLALAKTLYNGKRYQEASETFERCVEIALKLDDALMQADCLSRTASARRELFDYDRAVRAYKEAILLYAAKASPNQVHPRRYLGFLYADVLNNYDQAIRQFEAALQAAKRFDVKGMPPRLVVDLARVYRQRGDYERALAQIKEGEAFIREAPATVRADAALEVAKIYWYRGNYRRALTRQRVGLELAREAGDSFREIQAVSLAGLIALNQGDLEAAERSINAALGLSRVTKRRAEQAAQLNNLGTIQRQKGQIDEAIESFSAALAIDEELNSVEGRAYDLRNLAIALQRRGDFPEALERLTQALELSRSINSRYNELQSLLASGETLESLEDPRDRDRYEEAAKLARRAAVPEVEWRSLYALGRIAERGNKTRLARDLYEKAIGVSERLGRGKVASGEIHSRRDLYADAIRLVVAEKDAEAVHLYMERARARAILDILATRTLKLPSERAKRLMEAELRSREIRLAASRRADREQRGDSPELARAIKVHGEAIIALRKAYPNLARFFLIDPVSLDDLRSRLPAKTVVASYFVGRERLTLLTSSRDKTTLKEIEISSEDLAHRVGGLRRAMRAFGRVDQRLDRMAAALLPTLTDSLRDADVLVVLPDGPLHHVPFSALPFEGAPLLERLVISSAPSASVLYDQLGRTKRAPPENLLALAPADDLPFARLEAIAVAGNGATIGRHATETLVRQARVDAIDLAAHGELDAGDPLGGAILLHGDDEQDGRLEVYEVFELQQMPRLVTLSACDSDGSATNGNEWIGLSTAFFAAGSQTIVTSMNRVSDLAAAVLMKRFYRAHRSQPAGEALRRAALVVRRHFPHPAHWSNFVLMGDFR